MAGIGILLSVSRYAKGYVPAKGAAGPATSQAQSEEGTSLRVVLSGGGTGGHVYPALAVAAALRQRYRHDEPLELLYIGVRGRTDEQLLDEEIIDFRAVRASALRVRSPWGFARVCSTCCGGPSRRDGHLDASGRTSSSRPAATPACPSPSPPAA